MLPQLDNREQMRTGDVPVDDAAKCRLVIVSGDDSLAGLIAGFGEIVGDLSPTEDDDFTGEDRLLDERMSGLPNGSFARR